MLERGSLLRREVKRNSIESACMLNLMLEMVNLPTKRGYTLR